MIAGIVGATSLLLFYFLTMALLSRSPWAAWEQFQNLWWIMVPLSAGFGVQLGLYAKLKRAVQSRTKKLVVSSTATSGAAMAACCAHHLTDVLPLVGLSALSVFLSAYQIPILIGSLIINLIGIGIMLQNNKIVLLVLFSGLLVLALLLVPRRPQVNSLPNQTASLSATKSNNEGAVTVEVTPIVLSPGESPKFQVTFTTHFVELDFNIDDVVYLTDDKESAVDSPRWIGSSPGGHHRNGELDFGGRLGLNTKSVTLTFKNIAGIANRKFNWNLP